jgi:hypothetical protein
MITLITPPDIFENGNISILFMNISEEEQEASSRWFAEHPQTSPINLYYYQGENNMSWLLHAVAASQGVYLNCDNDSDFTKWITSYILSKHNVWYTAKDENFRSLMSYINQRPVNNITEFLEVHFGKQA